MLRRCRFLNRDGVNTVEKTLERFMPAIRAQKGFVAGYWGKILLAV
jgi:hypothetical protein